MLGIVLLVILAIGSMGAQPVFANPGAVEYGYWIVEGDCVWLVERTAPRPATAGC